MITYPNSVKIQSQLSWIKNISNTVIRQDILNFLALGPKFSIEPSKRDVKVPSVHFIVSNLKENQRIIVLNKRTNVITDYLHHNINNERQIQTIFYKKS